MITAVRPPRTTRSATFSPTAPAPITITSNSRELSAVMGKAYNRSLSVVGPALRGWSGFWGAERAPQREGVVLWGLLCGVGVGFGAQSRPHKV
ncbi:exported hypothetical protein [Arthrobacter sp. 9V]|nr:exported hypothetical protein [Arthrobacter sp. 9V]